MSPALLEDQRSPLGPAARSNMQQLTAEETLPALSLPKQLKGEAPPPVVLFEAKAEEGAAPASAPSPAEPGPRADSPETLLCDETPLDTEDGEAPRAESPAPPVQPALEVKTFAEDTDAIQALLGLSAWSEPSPSDPPSVRTTGSSDTGSSRTASPPPLAQSAPQKALSQLQSAIGKHDPTIKFYCRFPRCGKGYASTDAVRKHCRQRHLEWLRRLGHGCPALYCRWEE